MQAVLFIVLCFGAINVYAAPEAKDEETHNVAVKMVEVGLIQMDVNSICRAAGYVTPAELESFKSSGVVSDSTKPTLKEITEPITDKYDGTTSKKKSATEKYFSIDPPTGESGTAETVTEHTATSSSDKEATSIKFSTYASEYNTSFAAVETGVTKEITSETEKDHSYTAKLDHDYTDTRKENVTSTTEVPKSTKMLEEHEHGSTSSGRTTRDAKEATEKHTSTTVDAGISETTEKLDTATLSSDLSTSIATTRDERSPATDAHTSSTASVDDSSLITKESEKSSVALSTTVTGNHTYTSVTKEDITLASPAVERTTTESSTNSSATVTEDDRRTSLASVHKTDGHDIPSVDVESTTILDKSWTKESEKSSTTLRGGEKTDDKSATEEHTHTTVVKEHTTSSVHKKEASVETVTPEYHNHTTTTSDEKIKPIGSGTSTTEAASGTHKTTERNNGSSTDKSSVHKKEASVETVSPEYHDLMTTSGEKVKLKESSSTEESGIPTTTERNNGSSTDKIRSDRVKKADYSVFGYLALSLLIAAIIIWISYVIYTRHQSNSYVLPATAAEATPLNHITTTT